MRLERLSDQNIHLYERAYGLYQASFPIEERRDEAEQNRALTKDAYHFDLIMDEDNLIGVMLYWEREEFVFLEHFTTFPDLRGQGYGAQALGLLKEKNKPILLEIEPPVDEMTQRRYEFYKRNGFVMNPYYHIQAKYHLGDEDLELKILSFPQVLPKELYRSFYEYMTREIGILPNVSDDIIVRRLQEDDDWKQVAKLIYMSDPYIYPNWFDSLGDAQRVICEMMKLPTLYNMNNITVAVAKDGMIAGAAVSKQAPFVEDEANLKIAFERAGVKMDHRTKEVFDAYYAKMGKEEDGYYLANIAVDTAYRKRGIACALIEEILRDREFATLECVVENAGAWRLYQRMGFEIAFEYPGVHDVPCYKMNYDKRGGK